MLHIKELRQGYSEYNNRSLFELIEHVKTKYAMLDDQVLEDIMVVFAEPPDLSVPIDVYYEKQEECQRQAEVSDDPIKDGDMVRMLQKHMGDSGTLTKKKTKFDKKDTADRTLANGKEFSCGALEDLEKEAKCAANGKEFSCGALEDLEKEAKFAGAREFLANSTVASKNRMST